MVVSIPASKVKPSGADFATICAPIAVLAAGAVLDHHRLAPVLAHPLADEARDQVGRPARRKRHDDADRPAGKIRSLGLRCRRDDRRGKRDRRDGEAEHAAA